MIPIDERVHQAGGDLVEFIKTDAPAAGMSAFVETYFPSLSPSQIGDDLKVENSSEEVLFVRRDEVQGHHGWKGLAGSNKFRTSELRQLLDVGGGTPRDPKGVIDKLAAFQTHKGS